VKRDDLRGASGERTLRYRLDEEQNGLEVAPPRRSQSIIVAMKPGNARGSEGLQRWRRGVERSGKTPAGVPQTANRAGEDKRRRPCP